nr:translocation/assembly module TamB domain-containing protein [Hufsiella ginkgonis]
MLQFEPVQTYIAHKAAKYFSKEWNTRVEVGRLHVEFFNAIVLENVLIEDHQKDTLISSPRLTVDLSLFSPKKKIVAVEAIQMDNGKFYLKKLSDTSTNFDFVVNYFKSDTTKKPKPKPRGEPYNVTFKRITLNNIAFKFRDFRSKKVVKDAINFSDISLSSFYANILDLDTKNHLAKARIENLTFREKSGFFLKTLTANATIDTNQMEFKDLVFVSGNTKLTDYVQLKFSRFGDFGDFVKKVYLNAQLRRSSIDPRDLAYFVPGIKSAGLKLEVDGRISGYVDNIKARDFSVKAGQATYMKGNFNITGLPVVSETFLDLQFEQVYTNKKDAELIIKGVTGKRQELPAIVKKFGNIYFKGRFTGFPRDFIADGEFKTSLGRVVSDVNMKIAGKPVYTGTIKAYDFNIGELLDNKQLGGVTLAASVKGSHFNYDELHEELDGKVRYVDFKGYRYNNLMVKGLFDRKLFKGTVKINDRNLKLDFKGGFDLNPKLPAFNFVATIRGANLHKLNFTKDTLQIDADFRTNFSGSNLDNIQGNLDLKKIRLTNTKHSFTVDSVYLVAEGIGNARSLFIRSDIMDAGIKGQYDLNTLPAYFVAAARKYIPSLRPMDKKPADQDFELSVKLKYFEPLSLLFVPDLKIPEGATLNGKFVSRDNVVTLNGFAKLVQYKNIKINELIVDQTNTTDALNILVSSDRINFNDSLYVKNINIANILKNDSLSLNIKLSDKDAVNQLDLNGLVEFGKDTTATFSVLPSDVIINRENWKVQEKVRIGYEKGKTTISGFQLFRDNQLVSINGIISNSPDDELTVEFNKFKLTTFNPLTTGFGANLRGELNGKAVLASVTRNPVVEAKLTIDSLVFNNTQVGDLVFNAGYDNDSRVVKANTVISKDGKKTLTVDGTYNARSEENSLDMNVSMDHTELIIFEPFLKTLVSNLKGTVSADLKLTGVLKKPLINGTLTMNDAGMTVIYLKTPYHINDNVTVSNSVIKMTNLVLKDPRNHEAIANGTVDMHNPGSPEIHVVLKANNFLALNTSARDNPLYYGLAYGTGTFNFNGPTNNMRIDINARTDPGTVFNIPLNSAEKVVDNDLITFVAKDSTLGPKKATRFYGLTMNFTLEVDENSEANIYTDLGKLTGRGEGTIDLNISSAGDFEMNGNYLISEGKFIFTPRDYINKVFEISSGGSIKWTGNPSDASINLKAVYRDRPDIQPLYEAAGQQGDSRRIIAEAIMNLNGSLLHPDATFDLNFPTDASVKDELQSYLSDVNNVNTQALSFIVRRSFTSGAGNDFSRNALQNTGVNVATELIFNQFNNFLAQSLGLTFVDFNIRSLNEASATFKLFNERLILTGGVTDGRKNLSSDLTIINGNDVNRDLEMQYLIRKDGSLIARLSNRINTRNVFNQNLNGDDDYISAIGLVYRQEFDNFGELLEILSGKRRREQREKEEQRKKAQPALPADAIPDPKAKTGPKKESIR